jgi:hypothetical protein
LVDISVSATQIKKVGTTAVGKVEAGMAANARYKEKAAKYGCRISCKWWRLTQQAAQLC